MNIIPNHLMASRLQNIIDSNPFGERDEASSVAREFMDRLRPRNPITVPFADYGIEPDPYSSGQDEIDQKEDATL